MRRFGMSFLGGITRRGGEWVRVGEALVCAWRRVR